jgi:hypothetical protein
MNMVISFSLSIGAVVMMCVTIYLIVGIKSNGNDIFNATGFTLIFSAVMFPSMYVCIGGI